MKKIVRDVETLDDYDPTIVDGFLTRFLIERFFVHTPARGEKTRPKPHDIARVVDEAKRDVAHSSFANVTEDNVRRALAPLVEIGRARVPRDRSDVFYVVPADARVERYEIRPSDEWDFIAACDFLDLNSEAWDDDEHETNVREVDKFKNRRDSLGRERYAVVGYPRYGVDTFDNALYPLADQECRICAVLK